MDVPVTQAVRLLRQRGIAFTPHFYTYEEHGGTRHAADSLGIDEHAVVKTLVFQTDGREPLLVLMHGDREVSTRRIARTLGVKHVVPCDVATAQRHTGYTVGGISPFAPRSPLPVYVERTILDLPRIYLNGGKRGFLVGVDPSVVTAVLDATPVDAAVEVETPRAG